MLSASYPAESLVHIHVPVEEVDDTACDVGAVVAHSLKVGENITVNESCTDGTLALLNAGNVIFSENILKIVDDLFKRLYVIRSGRIVLLKC